MEQNLNYNSDPSIIGKKTFIVNASRDMIPEEYFQNFLSCGYECYGVLNDASSPIAKKIEKIISVFPNSLVVFDTTVSVPEINWESYIQELQKKHGDEITISVIYSKKWDREKKDHLKSFYTDVAKITGGFIGLEPNSTKNYERLIRILENNKVGGRRKTVRANCSSDSSLSFTFNGKKYKTQLIDISVTHVCSDIVENDFNIPVYQNINDAAITVNGFEFTSDIVLILRRTVKEKNRCIFMFINQGGAPGLADESESKLVSKIYNMLSEACLKNVRQAS